MKIEGLTVLLETLKEEIADWELEANALDPDTVRDGLYLLAMDILYAETRRPGGYESYSRLTDRKLLPEEDYQLLRKELDPFVQWFQELMLKAGLTGVEDVEELMLATSFGALDEVAVEPGSPLDGPGE